MTNTLHISFTGEYHNSLDTKNRLNIPAKFRKVLDPVNDRTFVLTRGFDRCLVLYPLEDWSQVEAQLRKLSSIRGKHRNFVRSVTRYARQCNMTVRAGYKYPIHCWAILV